jgi:hypothetical protein
MRRFILVTVALSFVALALSGCATGGGGSATTQGTAAPAGQSAQSPIVGKWKLTEDNGPVPAKMHDTVEFLADGTFNNNMYGTVLEGFYAKYTLSQDGQAVQLSGSLGSTAPYPIELVGDRLTIHAKNSHTLVFVRAK